MGEFMQWFKTHGDLPDHPKVLELNVLLNDDHSLYYLIRLWAWTCKYAENGDITKFTEGQIEKACTWTGETGKLMRSFIDSKFIDKSNKKTIVHDWFEENSRFLRENHKPKPKGSPRVPQGSTEPQDIHTDKTTQDTQIAYTNYFYTAFKALYGANPKPPAHVFINLATIIKSGLDLSEWQRRVDNYFAASWPEVKDMQGLLSNWDKFIVAPKKNEEKLKPWELETKRKLEAEEKKHEIRRQQTAQYLENLRRSGT